MKLFTFLLCLYNVFALIDKCSDNITENGWTTDMATACDQVSTDNLSFIGVCGTYDTVKTCSYDEPYFTRMRIYRNNNDYIIVFRPTQKNGDAIHKNRFLVDCTYLSIECGQVHNHFQEAFIKMFNDCQETIEEIINTNYSNIYVTGHSLGGSFELFMTTKLFFDYNIIVSKSYGFAGPFIGDHTFNDIILNPTAEKVDIKQIETVDMYNYYNHDGTVEDYNIDDKGIYINYDLICGFYIDPLPIDYSKPTDPYYSYGMHDLKNYRLALDSSVCF